MKYQIFRLEFTTGVHFGRTSLDDSGNLFCADTLFSALCIEANKMNPGGLETLVQNASQGKLLLSDGLPYIGDLYYVPRPHLFIEHWKNSDSGQKKTVKKLSHIPLESLNSYLSGTMDLEQQENVLRNFGISGSRTSAAVRGKEETLPYRTGIFQFNKGCGIYVIVATKNDQILSEVEELLLSLSYTGIGGRRSEGLGKFNLYREKQMPAELLDRFEKSASHYMTLSVALPQEEELQDVLNGAAYKLVKRSGFVASETYSESFQRKKDLYVFAAGACFEKRFEGDVYNVSGFGKHAVYRYAKPLLMGVDA